MSSVSKLDKTNRREKAEQVLEALVHILATPSLLTKFAAALPLSRVLLLLLGEHPSPVVAAQILILLKPRPECLSKLQPQVRTRQRVDGLAHCPPRRMGSQRARRCF
jgi:hypothetical protein